MIILLVLLKFKFFYTLNISLVMMVVYRFFNVCRILLIVLHELPPYAHWALTHSTKNYIEGSPGPKLRMSGGVQIRHGHAILDGLNGYLDSGDYQGECMSGKYSNPFVPNAHFLYSLKTQEILTVF